MANMAAARIRLIETLVVIGLMLDLIVGSFKKVSYAELRFIESKKKKKIGFLVVSQHIY